MMKITIMVMMKRRVVYLYYLILFYILDYLNIFGFRYFKNSINEEIECFRCRRGRWKIFIIFKNRNWIVEGTTLSIKSKAAKLKFNINLHFSELINNLFANKFDLITYWHVYEHLYEPEKHYIHWKNMLTEKGIIVIEIQTLNLMVPVSVLIHSLEVIQNIIVIW